MRTVSLALRPARPNWRPTASCWDIRSSRSLWASRVVLPAGYPAR